MTLARQQLLECVCVSFERGVCTGFVLACCAAVAQGALAFNIRWASDAGLAGSWQGPLPDTRCRWFCVFALMLSARFTQVEGVARAPVWPRPACATCACLSVCVLLLLVKEEAEPARSSRRYCTRGVLLQVLVQSSELLLQLSGDVSVRPPDSSAVCAKCHWGSDTFPRGFLLVGPLCVCDRAAVHCAALVLCCGCGWACQ